MGGRVTSQHVVRAMAMWVRRADAVLQDGAVANAAGALREREEQAAQAAADLAAVPASTAYLTTGPATSAAGTALPLIAAG